MNCRACQDLLNKRLDRIEVPLSGADQTALDEHLRGCPTCRQQLRTVQRMEQGLALLARPLPPPKLAPQIVKSLLADHRQRQRVRLRAYMAVGLAASVALFVSLLSLQNWLSAPPGDNTPVASNGNSSPVPVPPALEKVDLRGTVAEAGSAVVALTSRTADATVDQTRRLLPWMPTASLPQFDVSPTSPLEPATDSLWQTGEGVAAGFEPITNSTKRAVDLFLRDIPPMGLIEKSGL